MADLGTQALGAVFEPIKDRMKKVPVTVVGALLVSYLLPWGRIKLACYGVALNHPGALFYSFVLGLVLSVVLVTAIFAWRKERVKRHSVTKRSAMVTGKTVACPDPVHSMDELALYEKLENGGALWDVQLFGHQSERPQVQEIRILGDAAYCRKCIDTALTYGVNKLLGATWWLCPSCSNRIQPVALESQRHGAKAVAFARFKKDNPKALNNARTSNS